jgi:GTP:adenosylcobinamide-phosphate guanylyltransferase
MQISNIIILAAGKGSRVNMVEGLHKALLPHKNTPLVSHVINSCPINSVFHVAVGYQADQIKDMLAYLFPNKKFVFHHTDDWDDPNSGPHTSLLKVLEELNEPFVCFPCDCYYEHYGLFDTVADELYVINSGFPEYDYVTNDSPMEFSRQTSAKLFTGVFKVGNVDKYRQKLKKSNKITESFSDFQVKEIELWKDFGSVATFNKNSYNEVPVKPNQCIFLDKNKNVLKYFYNKQDAKDTYWKYNEFYDADMIDDNWFSYPYIEGDILTHYSYSTEVCYDFIKYMWQYWKKPEEAPESFDENCQKMIWDKTDERIAMFKEQHPNIDNIRIINDTKIGDSVENIIRETRENNNFKSVACRVHGDLQPENVIYNPNTKTFNLIDFRPRFGDDTEIGDIHYDISKLLHGCLVSNRVVSANKYSLNINGDKAHINIPKLSELQVLHDVLMLEIKYVKDIDIKMCLFMTALHYINIAPLYKSDYGVFLFLLGKMILYKIRKGERNLWDMI